MNKTCSYRNAPAADFAVIGDPISHSLSPQMHSAAYAALNLPYKYVAIHVPAGDVAAALDELARRGYRGVNVTVPHKEEALAWAQHPDQFAVKVRAANTVDLRTKSCINTDAPGFMETLQPLSITHKTALVLGAGGSARALVAALADNGWTVRIYNRTHSKAEQLADELNVTAIPAPTLKVQP